MANSVSGHHFNMLYESLDGQKTPESINPLQLHGSCGATVQSFVVGAPCPPRNEAL